MKTERSKAETVVFKDMNTTNVPSKQIKKHVPIMTEAFGDKENVVERTHAVVGVTTTAHECIPEKKKIQERTHAVVGVTTTAHECIPEKKKIQENVLCEEKIQITADDLTNPDGPSENYWKLLAEQQGKALKETLDENKILHHKCELLEAENETLKLALQEATEIIDVLNEIVAEKESEEAEPEHKDENSSTSKRTSPVKEQAKSIEDAFGNDSTVLNESDDSDQE